MKTASKIESDLESISQKLLILEERVNAQNRILAQIREFFGMLEEKV